MKRGMIKTKKAAACVLAAAVIASAPVGGMIPAVVNVSAADVAVARIPDNMQVVTTKGELTVTVPEGVSGSFSVSAYEMLQLLMVKGSTMPTTMSIKDATETSGNIYVVTDNFVNFFAQAKTDYAANKTEDTLYLTYDVTNKQLRLYKAADYSLTGKTVNEDYIVLDNKAYEKDVHKGKLDAVYFEADLVSRISDSNPVAEEVSASAARLFSDWASRYIKAKGFGADQTVATPTGNKFEFKDAKELVFGYYVIVTSDDATDADKSVINQSILNVPKASNVSLKATPVTIDKSVSNLIDSNKKNNGETTLANMKNDGTTKLDEDDPTTGTKYDKITANIGDILQYKIESHIPSYTSYDLSSVPEKLLGITDADALTKTDFSTPLSAKLSGKFIYTFRDTMTNQDFIPADKELYGVTVPGFKMEIYKADKSGVDATYYVKNDGGKYYLVKNPATDAVSTAIGRIWETDYDTTSKENFFAINFDLLKIKELGYDGRDVVFTYNAELKGETSNADAENEGTFTYSNDPYDADSTDTITDKDKVYTFDLKVDKVFSDGATTAMYDKVAFKLYTDEAKTHAIQFVDKDTTNHGNYVRTDSDDATTTDTIYVSKVDGKLQLHGLGEGTYYLVEQDAGDALKDAGYTIAGTIKIEVKAKSDSGTITDSTNFDLFDATGTQATVIQGDVALTIQKIDTTNEYGIEFEVVNQKGFRLPLTGEYGNWGLAIAGIVLVAVGGTIIVLVNRKKKDSTQ